MKKIIRLVVYDANEDDPKKCTAKKLHRFGHVSLEKNIRRLPYHAVLLNPFAEKSLSREDHQIAMNHGLLLNNHLNFLKQKLSLVRYLFY
jgi:pre-rRNA-processing protein TSR3